MRDNSSREISFSELPSNYRGDGRSRIYKNIIKNSLSAGSSIAGVNGESRESP